MTPLLMHKTRWFSLIEIVMVVMILTILISASRLLFSLPSKYIIEGEQCVNTVHGEVVKFFYEAITGKAKTTTSTGDFWVTPERYSIIFDGGNPNYGVDLWFIFTDYDGSENTTSVKEIRLESGATENNIVGCRSNRHRVMLSGWVRYGGLNYPLKVIINKNLSTQNTSNSMSLCAADPWSWYDCKPWSSLFTGMIDYMLCKSNNNNGVYNSCQLFFTEYIDTRSQTIFSKRCLSLPLDRACQSRSISSWYNF